MKVLQKNMITDNSNRLNPMTQHGDKDSGYRAETHSNMLFEDLIKLAFERGEARRRGGRWA